MGRETGASKRLGWVLRLLLKKLSKRGAEATRRYVRRGSSDRWRALDASQTWRRYLSMSPSRGGWLTSSLLLRRCTFRCLNGFLCKMGSNLLSK